MSQSTVGLRLDEDTQKRLKALGKARDRSPHYLMKEAVENYLTAQEAEQNERQILLQRWQEYEITGKTLDHAEILSWSAGLEKPDNS